MNKIYCIFFITFLIAASCHKVTGPTTVNGKVEDKTTNAAIANADVGLFETDGESAWGLGGVLIDEIYSDASGNFTFDFEARSGYSYYVPAIKEQYWNNQTDNITFIDNTGGETDATVFLQPEGWLSIHIKTVNAYNLWDYISISDVGAFYGNDVDTIVIQTIFGNQENRIVWGVIIDGIPPLENEFDYIYCPAFDTTFHEIFY